MSGNIEKVNLIGINRQGIREDPEHHGYALLPFKLSGIPDPRWDEIFKHKYAINGHSKKRDLVLQDRSFNEIVLRIGEEDDLQIHYDIVKAVIEVTNKEVDSKNIDLAFREKEQKQQEQKGKEKINRLKEQADKIKL